MNVKRITVQVWCREEDVSQVVYDYETTFADSDAQLAGTAPLVQDATDEETASYIRACEEEEESTP